MFKQLSQIGKNLSDEISKGLSDDLNSSQEQFVDDNSGLPKDVQTKLRKFEKYEQKYPLLLAAYKNEKVKSEKIGAVEKVLLENTPISGLDDIDALPSFFKNMNDKNTMLTDEIKRLTTLNTESSKGASNETTESSLANGEISVNEEQYKKTISDMQTKLDGITEKNKNSEKLLESQKKELITVTKELNTASHSLEEMSQKNGTLEEVLNKKNETLNTSDIKIKKVEEKISILQDDIKSKAQTITELEEKIATISKIETDSQKVDDTPVSITTTATSSNNNKKNKKNKKKNGNNAASNVPVTITKTSVETSINGNEKYESLLSEFNALKDSHSECEDWKIKYENVKADVEKLDTSGAEKEVTVKLENLEKERDNLNIEFSKVKKSLKEKAAEVEEVRDMLRNVGNELVEARDQLKEAKNTSSEDSDAIKIELEELRNKNNSIQSDSDSKQKELNASIVALTKDIADLKKSTDIIEEQKKQLQHEILKSNGWISELKNDSNKYASQLQEFNTLKKSENLLKINLTHKEKTILYLEDQVKKYNEQATASKSSIEVLKKENDLIKNRFELMRKQNETLQSKSSEKNDSFENYIKENGKLSERLSVLQEKFDTLQSLRRNSNDQVDSIQRQCEELAVKLKESNKKILSLEDDLSEYANVIQDKTREAVSMRRLISDTQNDESTKLKDLKDKVSYLEDEKMKLQAEITLQTSRTTREIQDWKQANSTLNSEIHSSKLREKQLKAEIETLDALNSNMKRKNTQDFNDSDELEKLSKNLKDALSKSDKKIRDLQTSNDELMQLNKELNKKFDRISKNYRTISNQLSSFREEKNSSSTKSSRSNSLVSLPNFNPSPSQTDIHLSVSNNHVAGSVSPVENRSEVNEKVAYIKNVLLGFLEHKEQRLQLLPVISMLLKLDSNDEKRLIMSLK